MNHCFSVVLKMSLPFLSPGISHWKEIGTYTMMLDISPSEPYWVTVLVSSQFDTS